ncbi:MAG: aldo/keto reductase [Clostridiales bacterium]|nr:aldo/keto reductase [Clostridiales bacterium]
MQYRNFVKDVKVSALGYGCMRFKTAGEGDEKHILVDETIAQIRRAIDSGVNYVDTAFGYHDGKSEVIVGQALRDGYREKVYLADKMPVWMIENEEDFERLFNIQLERLGVEHIDFYMLHALNAKTFEEKVLRFGLFEKMRALKASGRVSYIGFSFHDSNEVFHRIVDAYEGADFCQIQYNYIDTNNQAGTEGLEYAASKGLGVIIMEPLLGSGLVNISDDMRAALPLGANPVQIALDFLWSRPEVGVVLSGMTEPQHLTDNLKYADESRIGKLSEAELAALTRAKAIRDGNLLVPCTGCAYCSACPAGIDIPATFAAYNKTAPALNAAEEAAAAYAVLSVKPEACLECGACESVCPQHISIRDILRRAAAGIGGEAPAGIVK